MFRRCGVEPMNAASMPDSDGPTPTFSPAADQSLSFSLATSFSVWKTSPASAAVRALAKKTRWLPLEGAQFPQRFEAVVTCELESGQRESVRVDDVDVTARAPHLRGLGLVPARLGLVPDLSVADNIAGRTICALGDAAALPVKSFIQHFRAEFEHHIEHKRCLVGPGAARVAERKVA